MFNPLLYLASLAAAAFAAPTPPVKRFKTGAALRNPADPFQAARIEAAAAKRARRAEKLARNTGRATFHNHAHGIHCIAVAWKQSLNPTYIAK